MPVAGVLLACMTLLSIAGGLANLQPLAAAVMGWLGVLILVPRLATLQKVQSGLLLTLGGAGLAWSAARGTSVSLAHALAVNHMLVTLITAVSFLRLVTGPDGQQERLPVGRSSLVKTLAGTVVFASVINLSAVMIVGERIARGGLSRLQGVLLSRAFSTGALWSPFFASMGVALIYAPGSQLGQLIALGLPMAVVALMVTALEMSLSRDARTFTGYPMQMRAMVLPGGLALLVLLLHQLWPAVSILALISATALLLTVLVLGLKQRAGAAPALWTHVSTGLPGVAGEVTLFLCAGVFAVGIAGVMETIGLRLPFAEFGAREAYLSLLGSTALAALGVHPIICISTIGGIVAPLAPDPHLLGLLFLLTWGIGVAISPMAAVHLALQGRFGTPSYRFLKWNGLYVSFMLVLAAFWLFGYQAWLAD